MEYAAELAEKLTVAPLAGYPFSLTAAFSGSLPLLAYCVRFTALMVMVEVIDSWVWVRPAKVPW